MSALLELAERCEQATGPDRELDILIWAAVSGLPVIWDGNSLYVTTNMLLGWIDPGEHSRNFTPLGSPESRPLYTASLAAAMTLVPEINGQTAYPQLQRVGVDTWQAHLGYANKAKGATGNARTPALALCAAALRARAAQGMAPAGRGREGGPGSSELPSPVAEGDAPKDGSSSNHSIEIPQ